MSNTSELDLDLENLFQPAWAQGKTETNRFEKFTGNEGVKPERRGGDRPGGRGPRRDGGGGGGFGGGQGGGRPGGPGGPRGQGGPRRDAGGRGGDRGDRRGGFGRGAERPEMERREPPAPLPEFNVAFLPEDKGVEQLARQIRMTGRAYPLFQIALLILDKAERYHVQLTAKKKGDGTSEQIFVCALDESPWTSVEEAVAHVLKHHFGTFYQAERTPTDPPKGTYTFVAQCGMSGVILGPPNYHDYQNQLHKLHAEKFSRMPFDMFKARVKIVKDEAVVKKWIEEQSFKTVYHCLNVPEPLDLASLEEVEQHFSATHRDTIIKPVATLTITGVASRTLRCSGLNRLVLREWEQQRHFPLPIATKLSQQFANHGLQFFKVNKTVTHVSVARPQYLDIETLPVSENIKRIVGFINTTVKCTRKKLFEALAPTPKVTLIPVPAPVAEPAPAPAPAPVAEGAEAAAPAPAEAPAPAPTAPAKPAEPEPTPEQTALSGDLHWLIHQGHVLEFGDGRLETAKKPAPRPVKAEKAKPAEAATPETVTPETTTGTTAETVTSTESVTVPAEATAETTAETPAVTPVAEAAPAPVIEPVVTPAPVTEPTPAPEAPSQA